MIHFFKLLSNSNRLLLLLLERYATQYPFKITNLIGAGCRSLNQQNDHVKNEVFS